MTTRVTTREAVLDAAEQALRADGAAGLSMRRIARAIGTSYQVVYTHVGGKADIARALHDREIARFLETVVPRLATAPGTRARVHEIAVLYLDWARSDPLLFDLVFGRPVAEFERDAAAQQVEQDCFRASWVAAARDLLDAELDQRPRGAALRLAYRCWTAVHGITVLHLAGHDSPSHDPVTEVRHAVDLVLDAVLGPAPDHTTRR